METKIEINHQEGCTVIGLADNVEQLDVIFADHEVSRVVCKIRKE